MKNQTGTSTNKIWSIVLIVVGCIGLFDTATKSITDVGVGYPSIGVFILSQYLFGTNVASTITGVVAMIFVFAPLLLVFGYLLNRKIKMVETPNEDNQKKLKRAKTITLAVAAITASLVLLGMGFAIYNNFSNQPETTDEAQTRVDGNDIGSTDIATYLSGVGMIRCWQNPGRGPRTADIEASGSLWRLGDDQVVLTNRHAILKDADLCLFILDGGDLLRLVLTYQSEVKQDADAAVMQVLSYKEAPTTDSSIQNLNYGISSMPKCPQKMQLGQPVKVIGYPAFSKIDAPGIFNDQSPRTVTEGVISAYEAGTYSPGSDQTPNYFISAKIDSGSSGGVALSIDQNKLCLLGIPTWLNVGEYDTQGIVQNIHNVLSD